MTREQTDNLLAIECELRNLNNEARANDLDAEQVELYQYNIKCYQQIHDDLKSYYNLKNAVKRLLK